MTPFAVRHIDHLVLRVRDLERSITFYRTVLGCEVARIRAELGLVHLRAGTALIDLIAVDGELGRAGGAAAGGEGRNLDHLCLRVQPFDEPAIVDHLAAFGITPRARAKLNFGAEGSGLSLYIEDPDGNVVELKGPAQHAEDAGT